jgi:hypothetical protein
MLRGWSFERPEGPPRPPRPSLEAYVIEETRKQRKEETRKQRKEETADEWEEGDVIRVPFWLKR